MYLKMCQTTKTKNTISVYAIHFYEDILSLNQTVRIQDC